MEIQAKISEIISDIEAKAKAKGISISELCRRAQVARSTFDRWKAGKNDPALTKIQTIYKILDGESPKAGQ